MRINEIIRLPNGRLDRVEWVTPDDPDPIHVTVNGAPAVYSEDELKIVTVAELFEAAGFPVPFGARIGWYQNNQYWMWATDDKHCGFDEPEDDRKGFRRGVAVGWANESKTTDKRFIPVYSHPDLSRTPALDVWECLPGIIKAAVLADPPL